MMFKSSPAWLTIPLILIGVPVACAQELAAPQSAGSADAPAAAVKFPVDGPVTPPKVVCHGDQISIIANNSTLSSVLAEIRRCMGAKIDLPDTAGTTRIFDQFALGPARQVLSSLLNDTGYDYVIGSPAGNPEKIETVMLLARVNNSDTPSGPSAIKDRGLSPNRRLFEQMRDNAKPHPVNLDELAATPAAEPQPAVADAGAPAIATTNDQKTGDPATVDPAAGTPATPAAEPAAPTSPAPNPNANSAQPKSVTDTQITSMEQLFEQRRQMIQKQQQPQQ